MLRAVSDRISVEAKSATAKAPVISQTRVFRWMRDTLHKDNPGVPDLERIYRETLARCRPEVLVRRVATADLPRNVVAIGKCATGLMEGVAEVIDVERAIVVVPRGYPQPKRPERRIFTGGHPMVDDESFRAGEEIARFVDDCDDVTFLVSGGGSACVEMPLPPFTQQQLIDVNRHLVESDLPIASINTVRKHLSAIKGGRLGARVRGRSVTLVYSDVAQGDLASVASGPTLPDPTTAADANRILRHLGIDITIDPSLETVKELQRSRALLIADNTTLVRAAADIAGATIVDEPLDDNVDAAARKLAARAKTLRSGETLVAGGEPTVARRGDGKGGRCSEMALRFALEMDGTTTPLQILFGSSDGVDGSSGAAGIAMDFPLALVRAETAAALERSDSFPLAVRLGRAVIMPPTGNNLRDLYLVART